jgi:hypothetical protein
VKYYKVTKTYLVSTDEELTPLQKEILINPHDIDLTYVFNEDLIKVERHATFLEETETADWALF